MFEDDVSPPRKTVLVETIPLDGLSISDLPTYIVALAEESARAAAKIEEKSAARGAADSVFRSG